MSHEDPDVDYLALAQLKEDPGSFRPLVREAFALEYHTTKDGQIADIIGRDKSRVSQLLGNPASAEAGTIKHLVSFLSSARHRRRIIDAWSKLYFADLTESNEVDRYLGDRATERTRRRVDRLIREGQLALAGRVAIEAANKTEERELQEELLDRAYFAYQRLDLPGQAMKIVRVIARRARANQDIPREAGANLFRIRILLGLADVKPSEVFPTLDHIEAMLHGVPASIPVPYFVATIQLVKQVRETALVAFMERDLLPRVEVEIRSVLAQALQGARTARSQQERSKRYFLAARCHLLLGESFQAEELLEKSFKSGELKNLHAFEVSGLLLSRIQAERTPLGEQSDYLQTLSANCSHTHDRYHQRLVEWDLARVETSLFPTGKPNHNPD